MAEPETIAVRLAHLSDIDRITEFNVRLAQESESLTLDPRQVRLGVTAVFRHTDRGFYLIAEGPDGVVGQLQITYEWSDWRNAFFWWLQSVYVVPEGRRRGVLRAMTERVICLARMAGDVSGLRLYAHWENDTALEAYERLGLRPLGYRLLGMDLDVPGGKGTG
jgi:GNAT superfamily N-acetyltransferase